MRGESEGSAPSPKDAMSVGKSSPSNLLARKPTTESSGILRTAQPLPTGDPSATQMPKHGKKTPRIHRVHLASPVTTTATLTKPVGFSNPPVAKPTAVADGDVTTATPVENTDLTGTASVTWNGMSAATYSKGALTVSALAEPKAEVKVELHHDDATSHVLMNPAIAMSAKMFSAEWAQHGKTFLEIGVPMALEVGADGSLAPSASAEVEAHVMQDIKLTGSVQFVAVPNNDGTYRVHFDTMVTLGVVVTIP